MDNNYICESQDPKIQRNSESIETKESIAAMFRAWGSDSGIPSSQICIISTMNNNAKWGNSHISLGGWQDLPSP